MSDFDQRLQARIDRNQQLATERARAEEEMDRATADAAAKAEEEARDLRRRQDARHAELADRLTALVGKVRDDVPNIVVRAGWSASGEEFIARFATVDTRPDRALSIELDRDDDEVLARWHSSIGDSLELYHLLAFDTTMLEDLVLQVLDDDLWSDLSSTPPFPGNRY